MLDKFSKGPNTNNWVLGIFVLVIPVYLWSKYIILGYSDP